MTEATYLELMSIYRTESGYHAMNFIAIMSGYIAAAYFMGAKLSRFQVTALTFVYAAIAPLPLVGSLQAADAAGKLFAQYGHLGAKPPFFFVIDSAPIILGSSIIVSWIVSLAFMYSVRLNRRADATLSNSLGSEL